MITHAIPYTVEVAGIKVTATRYRQIDETRSSHSNKATRQKNAAKRRRRQ